MNKRDITKFRETYTKFNDNGLSEGVKLAVTFDEKDDVKRLGGRWHPDESGKGGYWWMPRRQMTNQIHDNGTLVRDELNDNKMIVGLYGKLDNTMCDSHFDDATPTETYTLKAVGGEVSRFEHFDSEGVVRVTSTMTTVNPEGLGGKNLWFTIDDARTLWNTTVNHYGAEVERTA
jgi:hypothetical protein